MKTSLQQILFLRQQKLKQAQMHARICEQTAANAQEAAEKAMREANDFDERHRDIERRWLEEMVGREIGKTTSDDIKWRLKTIKEKQATLWEARNQAQAHLEKTRDALAHAQKRVAAALQRLQGVQHACDLEKTTLQQLHIAQEDAQISEIIESGAHGFRR